MRKISLGRKCGPENKKNPERDSLMMLCWRWGTSEMEGSSEEVAAGLEERNLLGITPEGVPLLTSILRG